MKTQHNVPSRSQASEAMLNSLENTFAICPVHSRHQQIHNTHIYFYLYILSVIESTVMVYLRVLLPLSLFGCFPIIHIKNAAKCSIKLNLLFLRLFTSDSIENNRNINTAQITKESHILIFIAVCLCFFRHGGAFISISLFFFLFVDI